MCQKVLFLRSNLLEFTTATHHALFHQRSIDRQGNFTSLYFQTLSVTAVPCCAVLAVPPIGRDNISYYDSTDSEEDDDDAKEVAAGPDGFTPRSTRNLARRFHPTSSRFHMFLVHTTDMTLSHSSF